MKLNFKKKLALLLVLGSLAGCSLFLTKPEQAKAAADQALVKTDQQVDQAVKTEPESDAKKVPAKPKKKSQAQNKEKQHKKQKPSAIVKFQPVVKIAGHHRYRLYRRISKGKGFGYLGKTPSSFTKNHLEADEYIKTKHGRYWQLYVDGRKIGYVHERYFARHAISLAKKVSLVCNPHYKFPVKFAVNYVTDKWGSVVEPQALQMSRRYISCKKPGKYRVKIGYQGHFGKLTIVVRPNKDEGIVAVDQVPTGQGTDAYAATTHHYGNSGHYQTWTKYQAETEGHELTNNGLTLKTRLYQPVYLSLHERQANNKKWDHSATTVGHVPEGMTYSHAWLYSSYLAHVNDMQGHVVGYHVTKLKNPYRLQHLNSMSWPQFKNIIKQVQVSPYVPTGHGQAMGSSKKYVYLMVNNHRLHHQPQSELLVQLRRRDLQIQQIWSYKIWKQSDEDPAYPQNGYFVNDHIVYLLNRDSAHNRYEFWRLTKKGDAWLPSLAVATSGHLVNNGAPVQGLAYDQKQGDFYVAFNDLICVIDAQGNFKKAYQFQTGREIEGLSIYNNRLYLNLAQRPELMVSLPLAS